MAGIVTAPAKHGFPGKPISFVVSVPLRFVVVLTCAGLGRRMMKTSSPTPRLQR